MAPIVILSRIPHFTKGKMGYAKNEIKADFMGFSDSASDSGFAAGIGLGYSVNPNFDVQAEYAVIDSDIDLLTVGANLKF